MITNRSEKLLVELIGVTAMRAVPGLINLLALFLVANGLTVVDFGVYSTMFATCNAVSSLVYGPIRFSIVKEYARASEQSRAESYKVTVATAGILITLILIGISVGFMVLFEGVLLLAFLTGSFGLLQIQQEVLRAQQKYMPYTICALIQSAFFVALLLYYLDSTSSLYSILLWLAISNCLAYLSASLFAEMSMRPPVFSMLSGVRSIGLPYTISTFSENLMLVGFRYLIAILGTPLQLGTFSFCVDLAQRTVGFILNIAAFVSVPKAFRLYSGKGMGAFVDELLHAGLLSVCLSLLCLLIFFVSMPILASWGYEIESFSPTTFLLVGLAVILNRSKKLLLDPILMRYTMVELLTWGYLCGATIALALGVIGSGLGAANAFEVSYIIGYAISALVSYLMFRSKMTGQNFH